MSVTSQSYSPKAIVNYDDYPLDQLQASEMQAALQKIHADLAADGCAVIRSFLSPDGLKALLQEAKSLKPQTYYSPKKHCNVYLCDGDPELPDTHPRNRFLPRTNGFITTDLFAKSSAAHRLYFWEPLKDFLAACLGKEELHIYADPVSSMIVNVIQPGEQFNWHFDTNEFTITLLLKAAESGGYFEYAPNLRTQEDECYAEVSKLLDGERSRVKRLDLREGDLQLFLGRFSLHQVTENTGQTERLLLIMSFAEKPDMVGGLYRVKDLYGKVTDVHHHNEKQRMRADNLLD